MNRRVTRMSKFPGTNIPRPPRYVANIRFTHRYRFYNSLRNNAGLATYNFSACKLGGLVSFSNVANTSVQQLFEQVQIRSIQLWGCPPDDGSTVFISITANSGGTTSTLQTGDDKALSDTSMGTNIPAYVYKRFSDSRGRFTFAAGAPQVCNTANNTVLFTINVAGTNVDAANASHCNVICDIVMEGVLSNDQRNTGNTFSAATVALPNIYYMALDNQAGANLSLSSLWVPDLSLYTTT